MIDSRFFTPKGPFTLAQLAEATGSVLSPKADPEMKVANVGALLTAGPTEIAFLDNPKFAQDLPNTKAGAVIINPAVWEQVPAGTPALLTPEPYKTYARIAQMFYPITFADTPGIASTAVIDPSATIGNNCFIGSHVVIGPQVKIGNDVAIGANTVIERAVEIGDGTQIASLVSLSHCLIGQRVRILPGVRIGQEGFGFAIDPAGHIRIPQLGRVLIEDDVEIGANSTIDRGAGTDTVIKRHVMIDNLVQIAHNVVIGPGSIIVAQAGIAGSCHLGAGVAVGGQVGIAGHLTIGDGAQLAGQSGVMQNVEPRERMMGSPAMPIRQYFRQIALLNKMLKN